MTLNSKHKAEERTIVAYTATAVRLVLHSITPRQWILLVIAIISVLVAGLLTNIPAVVFGRLVDAVVQEQLTSFADASAYLLLIAAVIIGREVFVFARKFCTEWVATGQEKLQLQNVISSLIDADILLIGAERVGAVQKRIDRSIQGIVRLLKLVFLDFGPIVAVSLWALFIAFAHNVIAGVFMLIVVVTGLLTTLWQIRSQKGIRIQLFRAKEGIAAQTTEMLSTLDFVQAAGAGEFEQRRFGGLAEVLREKEFRHHRYMMSFDLLKQLIEGVGYVGVIAIGVWLAVADRISEGDVLTLAMLYLSVATPLRELHRIIDEAFESVLQANDLNMILDIPRGPMAIGDDQTVSPDYAADPVLCVMDVSLEVTAGGSAMQPQEILSGVSFEVRAGEVIGIAGPSGCGKSTLLKCILGVVLPSSGSIELFGGQAHLLNRNTTRQSIGYVSQIPPLFAGTLRDNLLYGVSEQQLRDDDLIEALRSAAAVHLALEHADGLERQISEAGRNLSGGERQRVAIARVLLQRPELIILDEATSALDSSTEASVAHALFDLGSSRTMLIVAHRLGTLAECDRVLVFDDGRLVQEGRYTDLLTGDGLFAELAARQGIRA